MFFQNFNCPAKSETLPETKHSKLRKIPSFIFTSINCINLQHYTSQYNTIATAEGVLCEAIQASPQNLQHSRCAVLGYGKCGRTITDLLKRMYCSVTVAALPEEELSQASTTADIIMNLEKFSANIENYDFIFNTIPAKILTKEVLCHANPRSVILDIASYPGGVDFAAAREYSITALACPGLPGKYAPLSSAKAILEAIKKSERS